MKRRYQSSVGFEFVSLSAIFLIHMEKLQYISPIVLYITLRTGRLTVCMAFNGSRVVTIVQRVFVLLTDSLG